MNALNLNHLRVLITQAGTFMGPALVTTFRKLGATVIADDSDPALPGQPERIIQAAGTIDAMIVNLAMPAPNTPADEVTDQEWLAVFASMVTPLQQLVRAALPDMKARHSGKIVLMGSAAALRGMANRSAYAAARGAQLSYVQAVGVEVARHGIQVNAIAQNFVDNPTYFPPEVQALPAFQERLKREVPLGRLVSADEDAQFAAYLCSVAANCFVGQVFPVCGGWVTR